MSHSDDQFNEGDVGPGFMDAVDHGVRAGIQSYATGFVLASLLTAASFYTVYTDVLWPPAIPPALVALAVAQIGVHLIFFLHITTAPDNTNNVLALAFGVLIVGLIIGGSVWIMDDTKARMMPTQHMTEMRMP
jgi:cytochrome o ubiquinol oxidase subunit IV